jgi:hypothetical protein
MQISSLIFALQLLVLLYVAAVSKITSFYPEDKSRRFVRNLGT